MYTSWSEDTYTEVAWGSGHPYYDLTLGSGMTMSAYQDMGQPEHLRTFPKFNNSPFRKRVEIKWSNIYWIKKFSLIWHFRNITFLLLNYFVWIRVTDEGSVPEMRIWPILLIKSDLKWCIHLSRSLFSYLIYLVSVTAGGPRSPRGHM